MKPVKMDYVWVSACAGLLADEAASWDAFQMRAAARIFLRLRRQALAMALFLEESAREGHGSMGQGRQAPKVRKRPPLPRFLSKEAASWPALTWREIARNMRLDADLALERAATLDRQPEVWTPIEPRADRSPSSATQTLIAKSLFRYQRPGPFEEN